MSISEKHIFTQHLIKGAHFTTIDSIGMRKLKSGAVAKIRLSTGQHHKHYDRLELQILDVNKGVVDTRTFVFNEILQHDLTNPHPNSSKRDTLEIIEHCGWAWYINKPTTASIKTMIAAINEYINFFE